MPLSLVAIIALAVTCLATTPPGHIERQGKNKSLPIFSYTYDEVDPGKDEEKTVLRSGDLANGRYYANSDHSLADVKYITEEWGYHPHVKYSSLDDHINSGAEFVSGEKAFKTLHTDITKNEEKTESPRLELRRKLLQIIQPYTVKSKISEVTSRSISADNSNLNSYASSGLKISEDFHDINYANLPQQQSFEGISSDDNPAADASTYSVVLPNQDPSTNEIQDASNDMSSRVSEDQLLMETAGNFGQRLEVSTEKSSSPITGNLPVTSIPLDIVSLSNGDVGIRNQYVADNLSQHSRKNESQNQQSPLSSFADSELEIYVSPTSPNPSETTYRSHFLQEKTTAGLDINTATFDFHQPEKTKELMNYAVTLDESKSPGSLSNDNKDSTLQKNTGTTVLVPTHSEIESTFSKPIIVAEVSGRSTDRRTKKVVSIDTSIEEPLNATQQRVTSLLSDNNMLSNDNNITTWSLVLNPIQAGVALVNAGKAHLIDDESSETTIMKVPEDNQTSEQAEEFVFESNQNRHETNNILITDSARSALDDGVQIQKSIEIYHPNPTQEIHYPPFFENYRYDYLPHHINGLSISNAEKYDVSETNAENHHSFNQPETEYEIVNTQPQSDDSSIQEYSNQNDFEYYSNSENIAEQSINVNQHVHGPSSNGHYQYVIAHPPNEGSPTFDKVAESETVNFHALKIGSNQEEQLHRPTGNIVKAVVHIPRPSQIEIQKSIEKDVTFPVEKVIEKKVPVPHPVPIPVPIPVDRVIEKPIPVPQPIPVTVEKIIEKKIPITVQKLIPQPYPVHVPVPKLIPVPVPVENVIEKKIPIPQPYPVEVEKIIEKKVPVPVEVTRIVEKPVPVTVRNIPYGIPHNLYGYQLSVNIPKHSSNQGGLINSNPSYITNHTQTFHEFSYPKPLFTHYYAIKHVPATSKKVPIYYAIQPNVSLYSFYNNGSSRRKQTLPRNTVNDKLEKNEYIGPVPPQPLQMLLSNSQRKGQTQWNTRLKPTTLVTDSPLPITTSYRKARHQEAYFAQNTGSFRQSKIEYGFKPPMVPSIQYDEETASKVES